MKQLVVGFKGKAKDLNKIGEEIESKKQLYEEYNLKCSNNKIKCENSEFFIDYEKFNK